MHTNNLVKESAATTKAAAKEVLSTTHGKDYVNLASEARTNHILYVDKYGGGHLFPAKAGKSAFPADWSADKIMHNVSDIATDPSLERTMSTRSGIPRIVVEGTRDSTKIRVILEAGETDIVTGFPIP